MPTPPVINETVYISYSLQQEGKTPLTKTAGIDAQSLLAQSNRELGRMIRENAHELRMRAVASVPGFVMPPQVIEVPTEATNIVNAPAEEDLKS